MVFGAITFYLFLVVTLIGAVYVGITLRKLHKNPLNNVNYNKELKKLLYVGIGTSLSFTICLLGTYMYAQVTPLWYEILLAIFGSFIFSSAVITFFVGFILHYYRKQSLDKKVDNLLYKLMLISIPVMLVFFFVMTDGFANYWTYPLVNGLSFKEGFVNYIQGGANIAFYALFILSGAVFVYFLCDHKMYVQYGKHGILESTFFVAFPAGIIGARIFYVVGNFQKEFAARFADGEWWSMFAVWEGGLTILGGAIMGIVVGVGWFLWRNKKYSIFVAVDIIVPTILLAQAIGRWGNFFNCEVHGLAVPESYFAWLPTMIFNNIRYSSASGLAPDGMVYVPLFLIESIANVIGYFIIAELFGRKLRRFTELGDLAFGYIVWYGFVRTFMEPLRDSAFNMGDEGYWSWIWSTSFIAIGIMLIFINHLIRYIFRKKRYKYIIEKYTNGKLIAIICVGIALLSGLGLGLYLVLTNPFSTTLSLNPFNIGIILLVTFIPSLILYIIPCLYLADAFKLKDKVRYDLVLMDMDGTIADTDALILYSYKKLFETVLGNIPRTDNEIYYFSGPPIRETLTREFPGHDVEELVKQYYEISSEKADELLTTFPYCRQVIKSLKKLGVKFGVVTNKMQVPAIKTLKTIGLDDLIDITVGSDIVKKGKPDKEGIEFACSMLGITDLSRVIYVGDNPIDIETAENANIHSIFCSWGPREVKTPINPTYRIDDYRELVWCIIDEK